MLSLAVTFFNDHLLNRGQLTERHLYAHVAAGHHDAVADVDDLVQMLDALRILNLGNNLNILCAVQGQQCPDLPHIVRRTHKGTRDIVDTLLNTKYNIVQIRLADIGRGNGHVGHVHALMIADLTAVQDLTYDITTDNIHNLHVDLAVVDQNMRPALYRFRQLRIG